MKTPWEGSTRRTELPTDWPAIRRAVLERDGHRCTWVEGGRRCPDPATDVDHAGDKNDHGLEQLRSLCGPHHDRRTARQANRARWGQR